PAYIQMSRIIPISLQNQIYAGATRKFKALFIGDYYWAGKMLPMANEYRKFDGAISKVEKSGLFKNVAKYDVSSLYPSLMRYKKFFPKTDTLGVFLRYLIEFMDERLKYKKMAEDIEDIDKQKYEEYH